MRVFVARAARPCLAGISKYLLWHGYVTRGLRYAASVGCTSADTTKGAAFFIDRHKSRLRGWLY